MRAAWAWAWVLIALPACNGPRIRIDDPDGSAPPWDAGFTLPTGRCEVASGVDLLFVVDNSGSMREEQASLAAELPRLVRRLVEPPDADRDGAPDWLPIADLHVGVVTTDLGVGGVPGVQTCDRALGDDALLQTSGDPGTPGCEATYPAFARFDPGGPRDPDALAFDVGCVARAGTAGCGFEQPLEAMLKALSPAAPTDYTGAGYVPPIFFRGAPGHGDGANAGFLRAGTLLAVVIVTDEEDCSASDPELFDPESARYAAVDPNLRCFEFGDEALHPLARYADGLTQLRAGRPDLLALALIAGVPPDVAGDDFDRMLRDPRMEERVDPSSAMLRLVPSCDVPARGLAFPPRRLVRLANRMGPARATVQSICQADFSPVAERIARLVGGRACVRRGS